MSLFKDINWNKCKMWACQVIDRRINTDQKLEKNILCNLLQILRTYFLQLKEQTKKNTEQVSSVCKIQKFIDKHH